MSSKEEVKKQLADLAKEGLELLRSFAKDEKDQINFHFEYQKWYSRALPVVKTLASDRYQEFRGYYESDPKRKRLGYGTYVIHDYIKGVVPSSVQHPDFDARGQVVTGFMNQISILSSVQSRINSVLASIESTLFADLKDAELATARTLVKVSPRAAGALAGVVLEAHLQRTADIHGVVITKRSPTIGDLNEPLKLAGIYETATWRKISYLADIRNLCSHKKTADPTLEQVTELVEGTNWVLKNVA